MTRRMHKGLPIRVALTPVALDLERLKIDAQILLGFDNLINLESARPLLDEADEIIVPALNTNRFYKRILWEVATMLRPEQTVRLLTRDNQHLTWFGVKALVREVLGLRWRFVETTTPDPQSGFTHESTYKVEERLIDRPHTGWTFAILCKGTPQAYLTNFIATAVATCHAAGQRNFEILLFKGDDAQYEFGSAAPLVRIESPDWRDSPNISRKKNELCRLARFSDIMICHDRFLPGSDFAPAFGRIGHRYGYAVARVDLPDGSRGLDWAVVSSNNNTWSRGALLNLRDYNDYTYVPGGCTVLRKEAWEACPWEESLHWNEHEDVELSRRYQRQGGVIRYVDAPVIALKDRWVDQNPLLPLNDDRIVLPGQPVGEARIHYLG